MTRMVRSITEVAVQPRAAVPDEAKVYDRSSFEGDFLVTVPDQSPDDFERHAPESQFCEYLDGTVYMPSPVSNQHQRIVGFLHVLLEGYRWSQPPGLDVLFGPAVLRLAENRKFEPDLFVLPRAPGDISALLVIEVVSPAHRSYDLDFKAGHYRSARLPEIWYVDPASQTLIRDLLGEGEAGYSRESIPAGQVAASQLPGFWIDVGWLWTEPLPNPRVCLETILAEPPG